MLKKNNNKIITIWMLFIAFMTLLRVVYSAGYTYEYIVNAGMDDQWMVSRAYSILGGQWLGPYSHVTLIKSVTYPIMLAFFRAISMPYGMGVGLFMVAVSFVFARAIKPEVKNVFLRGIFSVRISFYYIRKNIQKFGFSLDGTFGYCFNYRYLLQKRLQS